MASHDHGAGPPDIVVDSEYGGPVIPLPVGYAIGSLLILCVITIPGDPAGLRPVPPSQSAHPAPVHHLLHVPIGPEGLAA